MVDILGVSTQDQLTRCLEALMHAKGEPTSLTRVYKMDLEILRTMEGTTAEAFRSKLTHVCQPCSKEHLDGHECQPSDEDLEDAYEEGERRYKAGIKDRYDIDVDDLVTWAAEQQSWS